MIPSFWVSEKRQRRELKFGYGCIPLGPPCPLFVYDTCQRLKTGAVPDNVTLFLVVWMTSRDKFDMRTKASFMSDFMCFDKLK